MKCARFRKLLIPYAEGSLRAESTASLEQHLAECGSCAAELRSLTCTVDVLKRVDYPAFEPALDLRSRVMAEIADQPVTTPWRQASRMQAYSAAMAGLLLVAIAGAGMWRMMERGVEVPASTPPGVQRRQAQTARPTEPVRPPVAEKPRGVTPPATAPGKAAEHSAGRPAASAYGMPYLGERLPATGDRARRALGSPAPLMSLGPALTVTRSADTDRAYSDDPISADALSDRAYGREWDVARQPDEQISGRMKQFDPGGNQSLFALQPAEAEKPSAARGLPPEASAPAGPNSRVLAGTSLNMDENANAGARVAAGNLYYDISLGFGVEALEEKVRDFPTSVTTITELMARYREAGMPKDEYKMAQRLTQLDPGNAGHWLSRAQAADRVPMPKTAQACYQRAVKLGLKGADLEQAQARITELQKKQPHAQ